MKIIITAALVLGFSGWVYAESAMTQLEAASGLDKAAEVAMTASEQAAPAPACRKADRPAVNVRILSFNIRTGLQLHIGNLGINSVPMWNHRRGDFIKIVKAAQADLIGLQETTEISLLFPMVSVHQFKDIAGALDGEFASVHENASCGADPKCANKYDALIFYRTARFDLIDSGSFALSATPDVPFSISSNDGWHQTFPRLVVYAHLRDKASGRTFYFCTTHFDNNTTTKQNSVELLAKLMPERLRLSEPAIFSGDFNLDSRNDPELMKGLLNGIWQDSEKAPAAGAAHPASFDDGKSLIDHILFNKAGGMTVKSWEVLPNRVDPLAPPVSDHHPVQAELMF